MSEKMLVTQALDKRDLLVKKITDKIAKVSFVDTIKRNEEKVKALSCLAGGKPHGCNVGIYKEIEAAARAAAYFAKRRNLR